MFVTLSAAIFLTLCQSYRYLESIEMTLFCISDDFTKGFDAIELSTSLIGCIVYSFALKVWTPW